MLSLNSAFRVENERNYKYPVFPEAKISLKLIWARASQCQIYKINMVVVKEKTVNSWHVNNNRHY